MLCPEAFQWFPAVAHGQVGIAGGPGVKQRLSGVVLKQLVSALGEVAQGVIEFAFPTAIVLGAFAASIPARYAVPATPRARQAQCYFSGRGMQLHVLFERAELKAVGRRASMNQVHQEFVTPGFMVSIEFTVCSDQN